MVPYPGDWHLLKNYPQDALMKPYYDAGLNALAKASGYPLAAIKSCSQFKRTHKFLLEAWEVVYWVMLTQFLTSIASDDQTDEQSITELISQAILSIQFHKDFMKVLNERLAGMNTSCFQQLKSFIQRQAKADDTWRFWAQFVFQDGIAYIGLFLAIRSGDWNLRMACMKQMAPIFTAFDHPTYQRLIARHINDVLCMPQPLLTMLQQGGFVVSISGWPWHSVGIDEAHEQIM